MTSVFLFFSSLIFTFIFTPYLINFLKRNGIVDTPGGRKIHLNVVPRMGGILFGVIGAITLSVYTNQLEGFIFLLFSFLIITFCGLFDDLYDLGCILKFIIQNVSSIFLIIFLSAYTTEIILFGIELPELINYLVLHLFIVGTFNAVNLLDGLDGLVSGISLLIFSIILAVAVITGSVFLIAISVSMIGGLIGFLRYNSFPASIFLGDIGSLVLGFFLVFCSIMASLSLTPQSLDLTLPVILLALPIIDCIKVFVIRILSKRNPFSPDLNHIHYVIHRFGIPHKFSVFFLELVSLTFIFLTLMYIRGMYFSAIIFFAALSLFIISIKHLLNLYNYLKNLTAGLTSKFDKPNYDFKNFKRNFIILIGSIFFLRIVFSLPAHSFLKQIDVLYFLIFALLFMLISILQQRMSKKVFEPNVFFNLTFFFLIDEFCAESNVIVFDEASMLSGFPSLLVYSGGISFLYLFLKRGNYNLKNEGLLSGIDLSLISLVLVALIANFIFNFEAIYILSGSLLEAFTFYIAFKIFVRIDSSSSQFLSSLSFLLPLLSLIILFFLS